MRKLADFNDQIQAQSFSDFLSVQGIENQVVLDEDSNIELWVQNELFINKASELLNDFLANPNAKRYEEARIQATRIKKELENQRKNSRSNYVDARTQVFGNQNRYGAGTVTLVLIAISIIVFLISKFGEDKERISSLFISDYRYLGNYIYYSKGLQEVFQGQFWRLFTPIFIHFGFIHIIFNLMWLKDLGGIIEFKKGGLFFLVQVLIIGGISNYFQFWMSGPSFGGMSGVVYGLLGYIWMKGKYDPSSEMYLDKVTVGFMLFWFVFCLTGAAGPVANGAHGMGLATGVLWGYGESRFKFV